DVGAAAVHRAHQEQHDDAEHRHHGEHAAETGVELAAEREIRDPHASGHQPRDRPHRTAVEVSLNFSRGLGSATVKVGVVGLGAMGAGIAQLCVEAGLETLGRAVTPEPGEAARGRMGHFLTRKVEKGRLEEAERDAALDRLTTTTELGDLADCELVIEAIVEELRPKQELFAELDRICAQEAVLATNTSAL